MTRRPLTAFLATTQVLLTLGLCALPLGARASRPQPRPASRIVRDENGSDAKTPATTKARGAVSVPSTVRPTAPKPRPTPAQPRATRPQTTMRERPVAAISNLPPPP